MPFYPLPYPLPSPSTWLITIKEPYAFPCLNVCPLCPPSQKPKTEDDGGVGDSNRLAAAQVTSDSAESVKSPKRLSKTAHNTLSEIFRKIGSKENTKEVWRISVLSIFLYLILGLSPFFLKEGIQDSIGILGIAIIIKM